MPPHRPQAAHARRNSFAAPLGDGSPDLGGSIMSPVNTRRMYGAHSATSRGVFGVATIDAKARRASEASDLCVGNGTISAACGMARKFGQSPVKNGRDSWTLDAVNTSRTPAALSPTIERLPSYLVDGNAKVTLGGLNMRRYVAMVELEPHYGAKTPVWRE